MCFNVSIAKTAGEIASFYGINTNEIPPLPEYYNVSGFSHPEIPVLFSQQDITASDSSVYSWHVELMKWGLVPSWIKTLRDAERIISKTLNARAETLARLPSFRGSYRTGRCVVITDGFFEPHHSGKNRYPFYIRRRDRNIISLAGLYSDWKNPDSMQEIKTFTIITTEANSLLARVHNSKKRMPVILPESREMLGKWLDPSLHPAEINSFLVPGEIEELEAFPVSKIVYKREGSNTLLSQHPARYSDLDMESSF